MSSRSFRQVSASDQEAAHKDLPSNREASQPPTDSAPGNAFPMSLSCISAPSLVQTMSTTHALPQSSSMDISPAAPINEHVPAVSSYSSSLSSSTTATPSQIIPQQSDPIYCFRDTNVMDKSVRQFYAADGTSFIEHVPGHCLVFIPNNSNVNYVLRELRKIRQPKVRNRRKERDGSPKPTNAFIKYRSHKIIELRKMYPDISQTEISRLSAECWHNEPSEIKKMFKKRYLEEKRVYDINKNKRLRTEDRGFSSDLDNVSDTLNTSSSSVHTNSAYLQPSSSSNNNGNSNFGSGDLGLGINWNNNSNSSNGQGFNTGRRRSHTLPPGGFNRSGVRRRISQELRKKMASKNNHVYLSGSASAASGHVNDGINNFSNVGGAAADATSAIMVDSNGSLINSGNNDHFNAAYEFTAANLNNLGGQQGASLSDNGSNNTMCPSPFIGGNDMSASPMIMPLNPSFPIAEFATSSTPESHSYQHARSVSSMPFDPSAFSTNITAGTLESFLPAGSVINPQNSGLAKSLEDTSLATDHLVIDTNGLESIAAGAESAMSGTSFGTNSGYLTSGSIHTPWSLPSSYPSGPSIAAVTTTPATMIGNPNIIDNNSNGAAGSNSSATSNSQ